MAEKMGRMSTEQICECGNGLYELEERESGVCNECQEKEEHACNEILS